MSEKKKLAILIAVMVVLVGGASLLYAALGDQLEMPGLVVQDNVSTEYVSDVADMGAGADMADGEGAVGENDASVAGDATDTAGDEEQLQIAPDFTVYDKDGNAVRLSDFRGKPVIVNFWASWCSPCKSEMPDFQELYDAYGQDICFLMVNMTDGARETVKSASDFIEQSGYTFPVYYDTAQDAAYTYGVYSIPTTYFFDEKGRGIAYGQGALDKETLLVGIGMIYSEEK